MITISPRTNPSLASQTPDFSDPLMMMRRCHRKIENVLSGIEKACAALESNSEEEHCAAFDAFKFAFSHFNGPAIKHTEDEEISLFPRLRKHNSIEVKKALIILEELEAQHRRKENAIEQFKYLSLLFSPDREINSIDVQRMKLTVSHICALYRPHIEVEDELIFPLAERVLLPAELAEIGEEMSERRKQMFQKQQTEVHRIN